MTVVEAHPITAWWGRAACRGRPTAWWFGPAGSLEERLALTVCRSCPVRAVCLAEAMVEEVGANHVYGTRGGMTAAQRLLSDS